jgi:hypothetical protein
MEFVVKFYDHLEYFMAIWHNVWQFGIDRGHFVYFPILVCLDQEKSGNPATSTESCRAIHRYPLYIQIKLSSQCERTQLIEI